MSEVRKANTDEIYFLTLTTVGWIDVFSRYIYCDIILESLEYCRQFKGLKVFAFVIMSNHVHLMASHEEGKLNFVIRDFKTYTAKRIILEIKRNPVESRKKWMLHMFRYHAKFKKQNVTYQFWQKTNYPMELDSNLLIDQKLDYIHNNPVKAILVTDPQYYEYSSANMSCSFKVDLL